MSKTKQFRSLERRSADEPTFLRDERSLGGMRLQFALALLFSVILVSEAGGVDLLFPFHDPSASNETGFWVPTTYDGHGFSGTFGAVDFRYANPQAANVGTWTEPPLPSEKEILAAHSGILSLVRQRVDCSLSTDPTYDITQTALRIRSETRLPSTSYTHLETISVGDWVFVSNAYFPGGGLRLRACASTSCTIRANMADGTVLQVVGGPQRAGGYTWWQLDGSEGLEGWAVEATSGDDRQVLFNSPIHRNDTVVVLEPNAIPLNLRTCPSLSCSALTSLSAGTEMEVVEGPVRQDGYLWWELSGSAGTGWAVEALADPPAATSREAGLRQSQPTLAVRVQAGDRLGTLHKYGCANSGQHLHMNLYVNGVLQQLNTDAVTFDGEIALDPDAKVGEEPRHIYEAMPREESPPAIAVSANSLEPSVEEGEDAASDTFDVRNSGEGTLEYAISDGAGWLDVHPIDGTSSGESDPITVDYSSSGLSPGTYTTTIDVTDSDASNTPAEVDVTLSVLAEDPSAPAAPDASEEAYDDRVRVSWSAVGDAVEYEVWRSTTVASNGTKIATTTDTQYDDFGASAGLTYYYRVRALDVEGGTSEFSAYETGSRALAISHDTCSSARQVPDTGARLAFQDELSTAGATESSWEPAASCGDGGGGATVWYVLSPTQARRITVSTEGSDYDTVLSVWGGRSSLSCDQSLTELACNDNVSGAIRSEVNFHAEPGRFYLVRVGSHGGGAGGELELELVPEPSALSLAGVALAALSMLSAVRRAHR